MKLSTNTLSILPLTSIISLIFIGLFFISLIVSSASCKGSSLYKDKVYRNLAGNTAPSESALLKEKGFRFWLKNDEYKMKNGRKVKKRFDALRLTPGNYMIGFVSVYSRQGGAAFCRLKADKVYSFKITDRQYLSQRGSWAYQGSCYIDPKRQKK